MQPEATFSAVEHTVAGHQAYLAITECRARDKREREKTNTTWDSSLFRDSRIRMTWLVLPVAILYLAVAWPVSSFQSQVITQRDLLQTTSSSDLAQVLAAQPDLVRVLVLNTQQTFRNNYSRHGTDACRTEQARPLQGSFQSLIQAANLSQLLSNVSGNYTLFAPTDAAITAAIANQAILCQSAFEADSPCTSFGALLNSTNLSQLLLDHGKKCAHHVRPFNKLCLTQFVCSC